MSTEEEKEELRLHEKYAQNSMFGSFLKQAVIHAWMSEITNGFSVFPNLKDDGIEMKLDMIRDINDWKFGYEVKEAREITLEELEKELSNGREGDTDSIWQSEMMQNPCSSQEEVENAGDEPFEIDRQIHEAMARQQNLRRRDGETEGEFRRRIIEARELSSPIRITGISNQWNRIGCAGRVFLAHQREEMCESCSRTCTSDVCKRVGRDGTCPAYIPKKLEVIEEELCAVCEMVLDEPENFPKGFPDEWKLCCYCSEVWARFNGFRGEEFIHAGFNWIELKEKWERFGKKFKEVFEL